MHKVQTGAVEMGMLAQAILDSGAAQRLAKEVAAIAEAIERGPPEPSEAERHAEEDLNVWGDTDATKEGGGGGLAESLAESPAEEEESAWVEGLVSVETVRRDPRTCVAKMLGPDGTPYAGRMLTVSPPPPRPGGAHHVSVVQISSGDPPSARGGRAPGH